MARLGIDVRINNEPARVFFGETVTKRKFTGVAMFAWSRPENVPRTTLYSEQIPTADNGWAGQNYTGFKNGDGQADRRDRDRARSRQREALWHELQRLYAEELPVLPLYFRADAHIWPKWLEGVARPGIRARPPMGRGVARVEGRAARQAAAGTRDEPLLIGGWPRLVLLLMSFLIYALIGLMPGDPVDVMINANPNLTAADARLRALYGLDRPIGERYVAWLGAAVQGDLGFSRLHARPVLEVLVPRLGNTARPDGDGFALAIAIALPLGIVAALRPRR